MALVPVEPEVSTLDMARSIALIAASQPQSRVLVVNASLRGCPPAAGAGATAALAEFTATLEQGLAPNCDFIDFTKLPADQAERLLALSPQLLEYLAGEGKSYAAALFAVDSLLFQTRAIPLVRALDGAAIAVSLGRTTFAAARRMVEIIGRDHVVGAVAIA